MARSSLLLPLIFLLSHVFLFLCPTSAQVSNSSIFLIPIEKDIGNTFAYLTSFDLGTPSVKVRVLLDIAQQTNWLYPRVSHYDDTKSSTEGPFPCNCPDGINSNPPCFYEDGGCLINMCSAYMGCGLSDGGYYVYLIRDLMTLYQRSSVPPRGLGGGSSVGLPTFPFGTIDVDDVIGSGFSGVLSLSRSPISLVNQLSDYYKIPRKFALCLPSNPKPGFNGAVYFGGGPYYLPPSKIDLSTIMLSTDILTLNLPLPRFKPGDLNLEYPIKIKSIKIGSTRVPFDSSLLEYGQVPFGENIDGGSRMTTLTPYTELIGYIYMPFVQLFTTKAEAMNMTRVDASNFYPFEACYNSSSILYNAQTGPQVPVIDFMMEGFSPVIKNKRNRWRFYGSNSMQTVSTDVVCLAFIEGFNKEFGIPMASILIGGKQMEDNLIEFDQEAMQVRVNAFPLGKYGTSCSQFKASK